MRTAAMTMADLKRAVERLDRDPADFMGFEGDVRHALQDHVEGSETGEALIPELVMASLSRYRLRQPVQLGPTLTYLLSNDIRWLTSADDEVFAACRRIIRYVHNELPSESWGTRIKVQAWLKGAKE
jgi:hypothetical protein